MPYRAKSQFITERADGYERLVLAGALIEDDDPLVAADADDTDGRVPGQLLVKVDD